MKYTIDAKDKKLGRIASEAAALLIGKSLPDMSKNVVADVKVHIENVSKLSFNPKKVSQTKFLKHSGYRGGLYATSMDEIIERKGYGELMRKTVYGMLPTNKLRSRMIKNLVVTE